MQLSSQSLNDSCGRSYRLLAVRIQPPNSCLYGEGVVNQHSWGNALVCEVWKQPESLPGGEGGAHLSSRSSGWDSIKGEKLGQD